jgi:uncharacterized phage-associated protein
MIATSLNTAHAFLLLASTEGMRLTNLRLQRLVIIAHGAHLAAYNEPLFREPVLAWDFGPVVSDLYDSLRHYGSGYVDCEGPGVHQSLLALNHGASQAIRAAWEAYKAYDESRLGQCLKGIKSPWYGVWNGCGTRYTVISNDLFKEYYANKIRRLAA